MTDILAQTIPDCVVPPAVVSKELARQCKRRVGAILNTIHYVARVPWLAEVVIECVDPHFAFVDKDCLNKIGLVSSHANACRYCYGNVHAYMKLLGYDDATTIDLQGELAAGRFDEKTSLTLRYARSLAIADSGRDVLRSQLSAAGIPTTEIAEITYFTALMATSHRINSPLAVPAESLEQLAAAPWMKLIRPLFAMLLRSKGQPRPLSDNGPANSSVGPFQAAVDAMKGCPSAPVLRAMIDGALASNIATPRERGLILAVIARGIGSAYMETEARALLRADGMADAVIDGALDNLHHPELSRDEIAVMGYARNSVRNPMPALQSSLQQLAVGKSAEWIVDIAGQVAFANTIARICVLVD